MTGFPPRSPSGLTLPPGEIHVWSVRLDPPPDRVEALGRPLSDDEWARANRFRFDKHRRQYVVGRGALRTLLAGYLGTRPELVRFSYGPRGKPFLAPDLAGGHPEKSLQFNLSNSDEMALVGFVRGVEIGVDIEFLKPIIPERMAPLAGNTVHQDRRFMARYLPAFDNYLHYRIVDVSTLKELARRWRPDVLAGVTKEGRHEALADVYESIEELRYYRRAFLRADGELPGS